MRFAATESITYHDVIKWKHIPRYWFFVRGINRSPISSHHKGQWPGALMFSFIFFWMNDWVNNRETGDLGCHRAHFDVTVMSLRQQSFPMKAMLLSIVITAKMPHLSFTVSPWITTLGRIKLITLIFDEPILPNWASWGNVSLPHLSMPGHSSKNIISFSLFTQVWIYSITVDYVIINNSVIWSGLRNRLGCCWTRYYKISDIAPCQITYRQVYEYESERVNISQVSGSFGNSNIFIIYWCNITY